MKKIETIPTPINKLLTKRLLIVFDRIYMLFRLSLLNNTTCGPLLLSRALFRSRTPFLLSALLLSGALFLKTQVLAQSPPVEPQEFPDGLVAVSDDPHFSQNIFVVDKSERKIHIYQQTNGAIKQLITFPTDIGKRNGPKAKANDMRTPEGIYFLESELDSPSIPFDLYGEKAFTTDYPNIFDRRDNKSGYGIWLHAIPDSVALTRGSKGCVVVRNDAIRKLSNYIKLGQTPLMIFDKVNYVTKTTFENQKKEYMSHYENWRMAWEKQNVDEYIQYYDFSFMNTEMNYFQWYKHKRRLKKLYKYIQVTLSSPLILKNRDQVVIRSLQKYASDLHEDYGEKTIHAFDSKDFGFKIVREDWRKLDEPTKTPKQNQSLTSKSSDTTVH